MSTKITRTTVPDDQRSEFLPQYVGTDLMMAFENMVYNLADQASDDYKGGFWNFYTLSNGGFYMGLVGDEPMAVSWDGNGYSGSMSHDAFSVAINLMALSHLSISANQRGADVPELSAGYNALLDYVFAHPEQEQLSLFLD